MQFTQPLPTLQGPTTELCSYTLVYANHSLPLTGREGTQGDPSSAAAFLDHPTSSEEQSPSNTYVPSLKTLCLRKLLGYPEQVFTLGVARVHYEAPRSPSDYDLIRSLIPSYSQGDLLDPSFLEEVDPRLWALIVQILSPIPQAFKVYTLALSDVHLPLLQQIPPTKDFCLITVVTLRGSEHVDDDTIRHLGELHGLCVLDIACTAITSLGIRSLAKTLQSPSTYAERRGPWRLRILDLRDCRLDGAVVEYLAAFPLLSVVGGCIKFLT